MHTVISLTTSNMSQNFSREFSYCCQISKISECHCSPLTLLIHVTRFSGRSSSLAQYILLSLRVFLSLVEVLSNDLTPISFLCSVCPSPVSSFFGFLFIPTKEGSHLLTSIRLPLFHPSLQLPLRHPKRMKVKRHKNNFSEVGVTDCQHGRGMMGEMANTKSFEWFCRKRSGIKGHHIARVNILFKCSLCFPFFKLTFFHSCVSI